MNVLEKILEEIDRLDDPYFVGYIDRYKVKEIIRSNMDEMNNDGWIPVEERLPEEKINPITHDYYIYPVTFETEVVCDVRYYSFGRGHWWHGPECMDRYVTAWQPCPEPYKPEQPKPAKNTQQEMEDFWNDK